MKCSNCQAEWTQPEDVEVIQCPFCLAEIEEETEEKVIDPNSNEGKILAIVEKFSLDLYDSPLDFNAVIDEYFPGEEIGNLIKNLISNNVLDDVNKLRDISQDDLSLEYQATLETVHKRTFIAKDMLAIALKLLCLGLGIDVDTLNVVVKSSPVEDFEISDGVLVKYKGNEKEVIIPNTVTAIGEEAFYRCVNIKEISIPKTVTTIGKGAFKWCESLTKMIIPNSVTTLEEETFCWCENLAKVVIPETVTTIGASAFMGCESLTFIKLPNVTTIEKNTFYNCIRLVKFEVPETVTEIKNKAFFECRKLANIKIPNSVTTIGNSVFENCTTITQITIPESVTSIGGFVFVNCKNLVKINMPKALVDGNQRDMIQGCDSLSPATKFRFCVPKTVQGYDELTPNITEMFTIRESPIDDFEIVGDGRFKQYRGMSPIVSIPNSVTSISNDYDFISVFEKKEFVKEVYIPNSVVAIGSAAFLGCTNLTQIYIPNSITSISQKAFQNCTSLTRIEIPDSVTSIEEHAFENCTSLTRIDIPDSVTSIYRAAFQNCTSLTRIEIPDSVTSIGQQAFENCTSLTRIDIPDSVTSIYRAAFLGCNNLTQESKNKILSINSSAFEW